VVSTATEVARHVVKELRPLGQSDRTKAGVTSTLRADLVGFGDRMLDVSFVDRVEDAASQKET